MLSQVILFSLLLSGVQAPGHLRAYQRRLRISPPSVGINTVAAVEVLVGRGRHEMKLNQVDLQMNFNTDAIIITVSLVSPQSSNEHKPKTSRADTRQARHACVCVCIQARHACVCVYPTVVVEA